jgi:hypothetical protein
MALELQYFETHFCLALSWYTSILVTNLCLEDWARFGQGLFALTLVSLFNRSCCRCEEIAYNLYSLQLHVLAWLTIWPLDVVKSQLQSGRFEGRHYSALLREIVTTDLAYRGLMPGLLRSFIANGLSMVVYKKVLEHLSLLRENSQS